MADVTNERTFGNGLTTLASAGARAHCSDFQIRTAGESALHNITEHVKAVVAEADVSTGIALISVPHTTCSVIVNEDEPGVHTDFVEALERIAPRHGTYAHDRAPHDEEDEVPNGYAHMRGALLCASSVILPVRDGALGLGRWQRLFVVELDHERTRTVQVTVLGVGS